MIVVLKVFAIGANTLVTLPIDHQCLGALYTPTKTHDHENLRAL